MQSTSGTQNLLFRSLKNSGKSFFSKIGKEKKNLICVQKKKKQI